MFDSHPIIPTTSAVAPVIPDAEPCGSCDEGECRPICVECGEPAFHRIGGVIVPIDHSDCREGLGWRFDAECVPCQREREEGISTAKEAWFDARFGAGNWGG